MSDTGVGPFKEAGEHGIGQSVRESALRRFCRLSATISAAAPIALPSPTANFLAASPTSSSAA